MLTAHPYLPYDSHILRGSQIRDFLKLSTEFNAQIESEIVAILRNAKQPVSAAEISYVVCPILRRQIPKSVTHRTVLAHLLRLEKQGRVIEEEGSTCAVWASRAE
jgi:hypothetical protein